MSTEHLLVLFYLCAGAMSLLCMWVGFFLGVYSSDLYKFLKLRAKRKKANRG